VSRTPVNSSALVSVGYDHDRLVLETELTSGAVYQYLDVPESVFLELMSADSLGKYYNKNIRNNYRYIQL
jgi:KTSC domain-containing protein